VGFLQSAKKNVPWIAAGIGCILALSRDCTLNAYASSGRVDKLETRVDNVEVRLIDADKALADKLDAIYLLLARHHEDTADQKYCR
jgi:hypothetical protein